MKTQQPQAPKTPEQKRKEWEEVAKKSNGTRLVLSGELEAAAKKFQAQLDEHVERTAQYNKAQALFDHEKENFFFNLRTELETAGMKDVWEKGLAFDNNAKEDGVMVINVSGQAQ